MNKLRKGFIAILKIACVIPIVGVVGRILPLFILKTCNPSKSLHYSSYGKEIMNILEATVLSIIVMSITCLFIYLHKNYSRIVNLIINILLICTVSIVPIAASNYYSCIEELKSNRFIVELTNYWNSTDGYKSTNIDNIVILSTLDSIRINVLQDAISAQNENRYPEVYDADYSLMDLSVVNDKNIKIKDAHLAFDSFINIYGNLVNKVISILTAITYVLWVLIYLFILHVLIKSEEKQGYWFYSFINK